jgi:uncharacterized protein HemX
MDQTKGERPKRSKNLIIIVVAVIAACGLAGAGIYFVQHHNKPKKLPQNYVQSKIKFNVGENSCKSRINDLTKTDVSKVKPLDAAKILNQTGNCYFELGQYQKANETYQRMQKYCQQQTEDMRCGSIAADGIQNAKDAMGPNIGAQGR